MMEPDDPPELTVSMPRSSSSSHGNGRKDIVVGGATLSVQRNLDSVLDSALSLDAWKSLPGDVRARLREAPIQYPPSEILITFYKRSCGPIYQCQNMLFFAGKRLRP